MPITVIRAIQNHTDAPIRVIDREDASKNIQIAPGNSVTRLEIAVPWCDSPWDFSTKVLEFHVLSAKRTVRVYQQGGGVYASLDDAWGGDHLVPGAHREGGDKLVMFGPRGYVFQDL